MSDESPEATAAPLDQRFHFIHNEQSLQEEQNKAIKIIFNDYCPSSAITGALAFLRWNRQQDCRNPV